MMVLNRSTNFFARSSPESMTPFAPLMKFFICSAETSAVNPDKRGPIPSCLNVWQALQFWPNRSFPLTIVTESVAMELVSVEDLVVQASNYKEMATKMRQAEIMWSSFFIINDLTILGYVF